MPSVGVNAPKSPVTQGSSGVAAATLPNVCKMPGPPAPFVPTPLPNIGKSDNSPQGYSTSVTIEGQPVAIKGATFNSMGDVASQGTGGGLISSNVQGPTSFVGPGSMDVKIEGKNVQLLGDPMLNNGGPSGSPANAATMGGILQAPGIFAGILDDLFSTPIIVVKIVKLTFKTDHGVMKDYDADWQDSGSVAPKPEWTFGQRSAAVSHTKGKRVVADVELDVYPKDADATPSSFAGTAPFGAVSFSGDVNLKGGTVAFTATSSQITLSPDTVAKLSGDVLWTFAAKGGSGKWDAGASWGHVIYATMDAPIPVPAPDTGSTRKRMDRAVDLVASTGSADPHTIVKALMGKIQYYTLNPDPTVPAQFNHPTYFNGVGGAWPISDYIDKYAECQAIVRWVRALIHQVGCPGDADLVTIWADPNIGHGTITQLAENNPAAGLDTSKQVGLKTWHAVLVDKSPVVGHLYDVDQFTGNYMGLNRYEACLRFKHGGRTKYYGGGAGIYDNPDDVLTAFYALAWVSWVPSPPGRQKIKVEAVVRRWRP